MLTIKNYVLRTAALFPSFQITWLLQLSALSQSVRTRLVYLLVEVECVPVCGLFMNLPAQLPGNCLALKGNL